MIVIIDNYDSFVYNLYQYVREFGKEAVVLRNDKCTIKQLKSLKPSHVIISPGPCTPNESGISPHVVESFAGEIPVLGVCLGHQVIGQVFDWQVIRAEQPMHGKTSCVFHDQKYIYQGIPNPFQAARYHSLVVRPRNHLKDIIVTARTAAGEIMGIRHRELTVEGVQFHPESILTEHGKELIKNFLRLSGGGWCNEKPAANY